MIVVGLAAVLSFLNAVGNFSKRSKAPGTDLSLPVQSHAVATSGASQKPGIAKGIKSRFQDWQRDPFASASQKNSVAEIPGLSLSGIVWDPQKPQAVINGCIVSAGDVIADYTVEDIKPTVVTLTRESTKYELKLGKRN